MDGHQDASSASPPLTEQLDRAVEYIEARLVGSLRRPTIAIICGSGLGGISESLEAEPRCEITYGSIPFFPTNTVDGHAGVLVFGTFEDTTSPVVLMVGRAHYYEGHTFQALAFPVRVLCRLGIRSLIVTNAAGALNPTYAVGDLVVVMDHINIASLAGLNPLRGPNADALGPRFPAMSDAYDLNLRRLAHQIWSRIGPDGSRRLHEGVYAFVGGPSYETRAECRMLRLLGADLVGMSTVPETIIARHSGLRVLGISLVTNTAVTDPGPRGDDPIIQDFDPDQLEKSSTLGKASHSEVLEAGRKASLDVQQLLCQLVTNMLNSPQQRSG